MVAYYILQTAADSLFLTDIQYFTILGSTLPLQFAETGLAPSTTRYGRIKAIDQFNNESDWSNVASATTFPDDSSSGSSPEMFGASVMYGDESVMYGDESVDYGEEE